MLVLGASGIAVFEPRLFVGAVLPFLIGFALGNLDSDLRKFFGQCVHPLFRSSASRSATASTST